MLPRFVSLLLPCFFFIVSVRRSTANSSGFINIDCGVNETSYFDQQLKLTYVSDSPFVSTGEAGVASPEFGSLKYDQLKTMRAFPHGRRNCYNVSVDRGRKYLIKAGFVYLNYDGLNKLPSFELHIGAGKWTDVKFSNVTDYITSEVIHVPSRSYVFICLVNTGTGTPLISALELRPLGSDVYPLPSGVSMGLIARSNLGPANSDPVRFPEDNYDRLWLSETAPMWNEIKSDNTSAGIVSNTYDVPASVMMTGRVTASLSATMGYKLEGDYEIFVFMHFMELEKLKTNQTRVLNVDINEEIVSQYFSPAYMQPNTLYSRNPFISSFAKQFNLTLYAAENSTLPPLLNAIETYYVINDTLLTHTDDVSAIENIKTTYSISKDWQGDPCSPQSLAWEGLECSYNFTPVITSLNLSSSNLNGIISTDMANLRNLQTLDLSNNNLTGPLPAFLADLPALNVLKLEGNDLTGSVPDALKARVKGGSLSLSAGNNPSLCMESSCGGKKKNVVLIVVLVLVFLFVLVSLAAAALFLRKRYLRGQQLRVNKNQEPSPASALGGEVLNLKDREFTYSNLKEITNNFEKILGKGGSATVYFGRLENSSVAVKLLSSSSQGYKQFKTEVTLLLQVHHKNLTKLLGFCNQGPHLALVYEFMANGNLKYLLSEKTPVVLSWRKRVQIGFQAAIGLEYLHNSCTPQIIHRDIKTSNILLDEEFNAKISDFGVSKCFTGNSYGSTLVGSEGYIDPECREDEQKPLSEKSDVYSFGVVLLELITGLSPLLVMNSQITGIGKVVASMMTTGDIKRISDPRLKGEFRESSVWCALELAMACVSPASASRPAMAEVVVKMREAVKEENGDSHSANPDSGITSLPLGSHPQLR